LVGRARPGRDDDAPRGQRRHFGDGERVVALDAHLRAQLAQVLRQVVGERIVVVDEQQHVFYLIVLLVGRAMASARTTARALFTVSSNSASGSESATMPAPACR